MNSNVKLYGLLIILVGIVGGYLYYAQIIKPNEPVTPPAPIASNDDLKTFQNLKIDFSILNDPIYQTLTVNGEVPVSAGVTGRKDIFAAQ